MAKPGRADLDLNWLNDENYGPDPLPPTDPERAIRRIAAAVLIRALLDAQMRSAYVRTDARRFLEARDERSREILRLLVQLSGINRAWWRRRLVEFLDREKTACPPKPSSSIIGCAFSQI